MCGADIFLGIIAIIFPPIAVWVKRGICSADSLINIALCCLGFLPGLLHAWYIISVTPDPTYTSVSTHDDDAEQGRVTYYYVSQQPRYESRSGGSSGGYGTVNNSSVPNAQFPAKHGRDGGFIQPPTAASMPLPGGSRTQGSGGEDVPPSYQQAVEGDNKV